MGHLVAENWKLIHHHFGLISAIDALVGYQASSGYHVCRHTVTDEEKNILRLPYGGKIADEPFGDRLRPIIIVECRRVFTGLIKGNSPVSLRCDLDKRRFAGILGK